jgi:hypothetical protein
MRKIIYSIIVCACIATSINAQTFNTTRFGIMVKAPTFTIMGSNESDISASGVNLGWGLGVQAEIALSQVRSIYATVGVGFLGNQGGGQKHATGGNYWPEARLSDPLFNQDGKPLQDGVVLRYHLNVLEFPIGLKFYTSDRQKRRYFAELPIFTTNLVIKSRGDITDQNIKVKGESIKEETRLINFGIGTTLGFAYDLGFSEFNMGLHLAYNFSDMINNHGYRAIGPLNDLIRIDNNAKNSMTTIGIKLGLMF